MFIYDNKLNKNKKKKKKKKKKKELLSFDVKYINKKKSNVLKI